MSEGLRLPEPRCPHLSNGAMMTHPPHRQAPNARADSGRESCGGDPAMLQIIALSQRNRRLGALVFSSGKRQRPSELILNPDSTRGKILAGAASMVSVRNPSPRSTGACWDLPGWALVGAGVGRRCWGHTKGRVELFSWLPPSLEGCGRQMAVDGVTWRRGYGSL